MKTMNVATWVAKAEKKIVKMSPRMKLAMLLAFDRMLNISPFTEPMASMAWFDELAESMDVEIDWNIEEE